jgi:branched-chain amino acid transport system substrate-binding protein
MTLSPYFRRAPVALLLALAACGGAKEPILIGLAGPLGQANGESMRLAARMAVEQINAEGGIDGRPLQLVEADDEKNEGKAIRIAHDLRANDRVVAVIGHLNSAMTKAAAPIYNQEVGSDSVPGTPVLEISPASSAPDLSTAGPWTFRVCPTDLEFSPALARWARGLGRSRAAVIFHNDDYGRGVATTFRTAFSGQGGAIVSSDPYLPDQLKDQPQALDAYLQRALQRNADALVIGGQAEAGLVIIAAARRLGYTGPILGADGLTNVKDGGPVAEGVYVSSAFLPDRNDDAARRFVTEYQRRYQKLPDHRGAMTYDIVYMLRRGLLAGHTDRSSLRDYVARIGSSADGAAAPYEGVSGRIRFNADGDVIDKPIAIGVVRGGRLVTASR